MTEMKENRGEKALMAVGARGMVLGSIHDLKIFAASVLKAGMAPKGANEAQIVLSIQHGLEIGFSPMQALQSIAVINGKTSAYGDGSLAVCKRHPDWEWIEESMEGTGDKRCATCKVKRKREPVVTQTFDVDDAKQAKLWGKTGKSGEPTPWVTYPKRMLQMRARGFALRDAFPDALRGLISAEEAGDIEPIDTECRVLPNALEMAADVEGEEKAYEAELDEALVGVPIEEPTDGQRSVYRQFEVGYQNAGKVEDVDQVDGGLTARIKSTLTLDQLNALECMSGEKREALSKADGVML